MLASLKNKLEFLITGYQRQIGVAEPVFAISNLILHHYYDLQTDTADTESMMTDSANLQIDNFERVYFNSFATESTIKFSQQIKCDASNQHQLIEYKFHVETANKNLILGMVNQHWKPDECFMWFESMRTGFALNLGTGYLETWLIGLDQPSKLGFGKQYLSPITSQITMQINLTNCTVKFIQTNTQHDYGVAWHFNPTDQYFIAATFTACGQKLQLIESFRRKSFEPPSDRDRIILLIDNISKKNHIQHSDVI